MEWEITYRMHGQGSWRHSTDSILMDIDRALLRRCPDPLLRATILAHGPPFNVTWTHPKWTTDYCLTSTQKDPTP